MGTTLYLINPTQIGLQSIQLPGATYDSVNDAADIVKIRAAGGLLVGASAPVVAASALALKQHKKGQPLAALFSTMLIALTGQPANSIGANLGDANSNIDFTLAQRVTLPSVPLTAGRTYTILSAANSAQGAAAIFPLYVGARREIVVLDVAAFTKAIVNGGPGAGTLTTIVASKTGYVMVEWNGTDWTLVESQPV